LVADVQRLTAELVAERQHTDAANARAVEFEVEAKKLHADLIAERRKKVKQAQGRK